MFWMNFLEVALFFILILLFFRYPAQMYFMVLHAPHIIRAFFGFSILKKVPQTHELIDLLRPTKGTEASPASHSVN